MEIDIGRILISGKETSVGEECIIGLGKSNQSPRSSKCWSSTKLSFRLKTYYTSGDDVIKMRET